MHRQNSRLRRAFTRPLFMVPAAALALTVPVVAIAMANTAPTVTAIAAGYTATAAGYTATAPTVAISGGTRYQRIDGFGVSEGFGQAEGIRFAPAKTQAQVLTLLFSTISGAGLTIVRNEIGAGSGATIEPNAPASPTRAPKYVPLSATGDDQGQLWLAQTIKAKFRVTDIFADAWSPPAFMKTNDSVAHGGALCGVPGAACASGDWRQAYANYLRQYATDYSAAGVPLSYIGPLNEPGWITDYDSTSMTPAQAANFLQYLGPTMKASHLPTRVECCAAIGWSSAQQYAAAIAADPKAAADTTLLTSHGYAGAPATRPADWKKPSWETEWSTFEAWDPAWDDGSDASGFTWAQHIYTGLTGANLSAFLYWWGTANGDNESLIRLHGTSVTASSRLWAFAGYSRFVRPGAVRLKATAANKNLQVTAFRNSNGSVAIVVLNTAKSAQAASFSVSGISHLGETATPYITDATTHGAAQKRLALAHGSFSMKLPARSLVTFTVPASSAS
jgi:O-glycosyl hydrolase